MLEEWEITREDITALEETKENKAGDIIVECMQWGMHAYNRNELVINGRFEELTEKKMFRGLLNRKRCVLMANGYYEWDETSSSRIRPYLIQRAKKGEYLLLACLYNDYFKG